MEVNITVKSSTKRYKYLPPTRMSENEIKIVYQRAEELGFNKSEYVRYCIKKEMEGR